MEINEQGFFVVQSGETITITVTASGTDYMAAFPPAPSCTSWSRIDGPVGNTESRQFIAPVSGSECFLDITFDFQSDVEGNFPPNAKYEVNVAGSAGGSFNDFPVVPPPVRDRAYEFHVV
jgi:hypothetical protein